MRASLLSKQSKPHQPLKSCELVVVKTFNLQKIIINNLFGDCNTINYFVLYFTSVFSRRLHMQFSYTEYYFENFDRLLTMEKLCKMQLMNKILLMILVKVLCLAIKLDDRFNIQLYSVFSYENIVLFHFLYQILTRDVKDMRFRIEHIKSIQSVSVKVTNVILFQTSDNF